ncbi:hypothetical protein CLU79DRAFT_744863 [Phycomyces nitens]|nr:hypothetical protein CLU79DRAFT_744863 [Phycomyces nitens]
MLFKSISKLKKSASCPSHSPTNSLKDKEPFNDPTEKTDTPSFKIELPTSRCVPHSMRALNLSSLVIEPYHIYTPTEPPIPEQPQSQHPCNRWLSRKLSKARSRLTAEPAQEPPKNPVSDRYLAKLEDVQYRLKRLIQPHKIIYEIEYNRDGRWLQLETKTSANLDAVHKKGFSKMDVRFDKNLMQHNIFEGTLKHKDSFDVQIEIWYMQSTENPNSEGGLRTRRVRWWKTTDRGMAYLPGTYHDTSSLPMTRNHVLGFFTSLQDNSSTPPSLADTDGTVSTQDLSFDGSSSPRISWTDRGFSKDTPFGSTPLTYAEPTLGLP